MFGSGNKVSDVTSELATVRNDLARLASTVGNLLSSTATSSATRESMEDMKDRLYSRASDWSSQGSHLASEARDRLYEANSELETRIERHPIAAVLIAAGIGMAIGLMSRSRS
jgi:ElaB/YqjD/DUF883 family membrane-anchored ribosome-binding protein